MKEDLQYCSDLIIRDVILGQTKQRKAALIHIQGISGNESISFNVMNPLLQKWKLQNMDEVEESFLWDELKMNTFRVSHVQAETEWNAMMLAILNGDTAIFVDHISKVLLLDTKGGQFRSVSESTAQTIIGGPKDSFTESIATNMSLLRNRIRNSHLKMEMQKAGDISHTNIVITYVDNKVNREILDNVKQKIQNINGIYLYRISH
ncbi:spore germination protein [Bacillus sp. 165]|uniref:spore germination protein n=1 Tax=Bacillus sp. 165 TaxID=1529117 RepID=UPI0032AEF5C1